MSKRLQTLVFLAVCAGVLIFFLMAPESTTPVMPADDHHRGRKTDFTACFECHPPDTLPEDHTINGQVPPEGKTKCYFCHKVENE